jgi:hypothetical protein
MIAAEQTFFNAVVAAEATRQHSKSLAFAAYAYNPANLTTYRTALQDADTAYFTAVNTALNASNLPLGNLGFGGPLDVSNWCSLQGMA